MKQRYLLVLGSLAAISVAYADQLKNKDTYYTAAPVKMVPGQFDRLDGTVASMDHQRGVPTFIWADRITPEVAPHQTPIRAARWYLSEYAGAYRLNKASLSTSYASEVHDTGRGGILVTFRQRVNGIDVVRNELHVLMTRDFRLIAITGNLHEAAVPQQSLVFGLPAEAAVARALTDLTGAAVATGDIDDSGSRSSGGYGYYNLLDQTNLVARGVEMSEPARVRKVLYPLPDRLVPGYYVELITNAPRSASVIGHGYTVAADSGDVLMRHGLSHSDVFTYRVWAEDTGYLTPLDGPQENYTPHPIGLPWSGYVPAYVPNTLISVEGFNTNPMGQADPWLPAGATVTTGNNVDAYADIVSPDGFSTGDVRPTISSPNTFDYIYDPLQAPDVSVNQRRASVTQLFYTTNWLHDYFYDSGFDEASGNAQQDNYGRGGLAGDRLHVQGQDFGGTNNANMLTPADGSSPRMQMYLWNGPSPSSVTANGTNYTSGTASWGPQTFNTTANLVLAIDGQGADINDGCEAITNNVVGQIALIHRGNCNFTLKTQNAEAAGAVGVVLSNNTPLAGPPGMGGTPTGPINIGTLSITFEAGQIIEAALNTPPVSVTLFRGPAEVMRDGTIDNAIIAHEWGHYIHNRLTDCGTQQCGGQGEGWGDFFALHTVTRDGDDTSGVFAMAGYSTAVLGDSTYFGIRRVPYSTDFAKNGLTYRHIQNGEPLPAIPLNGGGDNSQVHNAGEIWASFLFEGYAAIINQTPNVPFETARRAMADYVVLGMKLAPTDATYSEQLDAIKAAALSSNPTDYALLVQAFATRGAGSCSEAPPRNSTDLIGVVEDFMVRGAVEIVSVTVDDAITSCDSDGNLDAEEVGNLTVTVGNPGDAELTNTSIMVTASNTNVSFPSGTSANLASLLPGDTATVTFEVQGSNVLSMTDSVQIDIVATNNAACDPTVLDSASFNLHFDETPATTDSVETTATTWTTGGTVPDSWRRTVDMDDGANHVWYGEDLSSPNDTYATTAPIMVGTAGDFLVSWAHRYKFEFSGGIFWDGGVVEFSTDNGVTWQDISVLAQPGYDGVINTNPNSPISNRPAYGNESPNWPNFNTVSLNLGTSLQGQAVRLRFRIGTDDLVGDFGWEIDDLSVSGVDNLPFVDVGPETMGCNPPPTADAGPDVTVNAGDTVVLDGSNSSDPEGEPLNYSWTELVGPGVTLNNPTMAMTDFVAPSPPVDMIITFELTVDDGVYSATDMVDVTVLADVVGTPDAGVPDAGMVGPDAGMGTPDAGPGQPDAGTTPPTPDDGCCQSGRPPSSGSLSLLALAMFGIAVVTRRRRRDA